MALKHTFQSAKADGADATLVRPSDWNADHEADADGISMVAGSTDPATPAAGHMMFYSKLIAGRALPKIKGPSGVDSALQTSLFTNRVMLWSPATGTTIGSQGMTPTTGATLSHPTPAMTNIGLSLDRLRFATSTTAGNASGAWAPRYSMYGGSANTPGGWFFFCRFCQGSLHTTGVQKAVGVSSVVAALGGDPSSSVNDFCGMHLNAADASWYFCVRAGTAAATRSAALVAAAADQVFDLAMFVKPGTSEIFVRVQSIANSGVGTDLLNTSYASNVPTATTLLGPRIQVRNGALAAAHNIEMVRLYVESDF
jgi:hypothetical protein